MNGRNPFSWRARARSFVYAFHGMRALFRYEHNAWIHTVAATLAIILGIILRISALEWIVVIILIGAVLALESVNSAVEALADKISPEFSPLIKKAKDLAAAAVLFMAIAALISGIIIFIPKIITALKVLY